MRNLNYDLINILSNTQNMISAEIKQNIQDSLISDTSYNKCISELTRTLIIINSRLSQIKDNIKL